MDEILFDSNFRIYKCTSIPRLESKQFEKVQLQSLFLKVLTSLFRSTSSPLPLANSKYLVSASGKNSIFDASLYDHYNPGSKIDWRYIRNNIKISFKQEQAENVYVSYVTVSFPKGVRLRRQKFIFMQKIEKDTNNSAKNDQSIIEEQKTKNLVSESSDFNTVLLISTSQAKFGSVFLKYCSTSLIRSKPILVLPVTFTNTFFHKFLNLLYHDSDKIENRGILNIAFKPKTTANSLSEIRIDVNGNHLREYLITGNKSSSQGTSEPIDLIYGQLFKHTAIDFYGLPISKIRISECVSFLDSNKVYFFGTPNRFPILDRSLKSDTQNVVRADRNGTENDDDSRNESDTVFITDILELLL